MEKLPWDVRHEVVIRDEDETNPSYGSSPANRSIADNLKYGIINLDKPSGPTSHEVVAWVKRILNIGHAGQGGTLDPKVTGVLPIALEEATKVAQTFLSGGKEYVCIMRLHNHVPSEDVLKVMKEFVGEIYQRPPLRSSVSRVIRKRRIYYIKDFEFKENWVLFRIGCQAGTYIRKICFDIGEAVGCGAHMEELRRTRAGPFIEDQGLVTLYDLYEAYNRWIANKDESLLRKLIKPVEDATVLLPKIVIRDSAVDSICHGANLAVPGILKLESQIKPKMLIGVFTLKDELVALAKATMSTEEMVGNEHGIAADTLRVIIIHNTYPNMWQSNKN
jgi:H/ACA ribonucleoprotein complex subunit 4